MSTHNSRASRISVVTQADGSIDVVVPASMAQEFKLLVRRGTNTYPSKHVEIADFRDRLLGEVSSKGEVSPTMKQELYGYPRYSAPKKA